MDYRRLCALLITELRKERGRADFYYEESRRLEDRLRVDPEIEAEQTINNQLAQILELSRQLQDVTERLEELTTMIDAVTDKPK